MWTIYLFPTGVFWANHDDGRFAFGKYDPVNKKILDWNEFSSEKKEE